MPRSGSTLLAEVLNTNPKSKTASESFALNHDNVQLLKNYFEEDFLTERYIDVSALDLEKIKSYYTALSEGKTWNSYYWSDLLSKNHHYNTCRTIFKTHKVTYHYDDLMNHFKDDFGIYLLRNPIAVSLSRVRMGWSTYIDDYTMSNKTKGFFSKDLKQTIEEVKQTGTELEKQVLSWCLENSVFLMNRLKGSTPKNVMTVFYEDLILNPKKTLLKICSMTGIDYHPDMLQLFNRPSSGIVHSKELVKQEILAGNSLYLVNRWKKEVDIKSQQRIKKLLGKFGYDFYL